MNLTPCPLAADPGRYRQILHSYSETGKISGADARALDVYGRALGFDVDADVRHAERAFARQPKPVLPTLMTANRGRSD